jgi:hypothetical protein
MQLADLPPAALADLCDETHWRLDIDPGFDTKHEFWMTWQHFLTVSDWVRAHGIHEDDVLAEFQTIEGYDILLPVPRSHHPDLHVLRLIPSADTQTLTLFLQDTFHKGWFRDAMAARYGFLAVADRYQQHGCDFYVASYYHFAYLLHHDYEVARRLLAEKNLGKRGGDREGQ